MEMIDTTVTEAPAALRVPRTDHASAQLIDRSLGVQACYGTLNAAKLLNAKGIPINVALRVLLRSGRHRQLAPDAPLQLRHYGMAPALAYSHTSTWKSL